MRLFSKVQLFSLTILLLASCHLSKNVPVGNHLLRSTTITLDNPLTTKLDRYELTQVLRQQPNARFFGAPWKLWLYNAMDSTAVAQKKAVKLARSQSHLDRRTKKVKSINAKRNARALRK